VKSTIERPDPFLDRAKITAVHRRTSLKNLVIAGLGDDSPRRDSGSNALTRLTQGYPLGGQRLSRDQPQAAESFFDTHILLYAYDRDTPAKRSVARTLLEQAWLQPGRFAISVRVLQEFRVHFVWRKPSDGRSRCLDRRLRPYSIGIDRLERQPSGGTPLLL